MQSATPRQHALRPLCLTIVTAFTAPVTHATPVSDMDTLVVTVVRADSDEQRVVRPLVIKDKAALDQQQPDSTAEALQYEPNLTPSGGSRPGNQTVNIRGLEGARVLQTIDGVRQNFESGHRPTYLLDTALLKNVQVLKGPSSTLWGSGAVGGVVAQETVDANDLLKPEQSIGGLIKHTYNDNGEKNTTTVAVGARTQTIDLLASTYYSDGNDITHGDGRDLANSASRQHGALLKGEWQIDDAQSLALQLRRSEDSGSVPNNSAANESTSNFLIERDITDKSASIDYRVDTDSPWVNAQVLAYRTETTMDEARVSDGRGDSTETESTGININNRSDIGSMNLLYGIDGYRDEFTTAREGRNRPIPLAAEVNVRGAFAQATIPLIDQVLRGEIGLRHDSFQTEVSDTTGSHSDDALSPSAALVWQTTNWLELAIRYDEAFRAPSVEELYTTGTHFCLFGTFCNKFVSNPNLEAETAENKELLAKMNWSGLFDDTDELKVKASFFRNDVDNFIEQFVTDPVFFPAAKRTAGITSWRNVNKARLEGFELESTYHWQDLTLRAAYGQTNGEDLEEHDGLANVPAKKWTLDANYAFIPEAFTAGIRWTHADEQDDLPSDNGNGEYNGYAITDL